MVRPFKKDINFLGHRKVFFAISLVLLVISFAALPIRHINFGIEFVGGTAIDFKDTGALTIDEMREAFENAGVANPTIQTTTEARTGVSGFI
ncbi:MAG: protein translocase subunit SecF, partial [Coriobacteriales bacterium]|nr:protein translocase subunit SecF [Coriobacteriales bacterium]